MKELVSPRQVAQAIGASESSLKRWCDQGKIPTVYTAGGHRRIPVSGVLTFLRKAGMEIRSPEILGLPAATTGGGERKLHEEQARLLQALVRGEESVCVEVTLNLYLANYPMSLICDEVLAKAFEQIGEKWGCGDVAVYQERRSCELCHRVMHELRRSLPELPVDAPIAVGGTIDGDPYTLASAMAELVLRDLGFRAASLGNMLPFSSLAHALCDTQPKLFWVSVSAIRDLDQFLEEFDRLSTLAFENQVTLVVGGKALTDDVRKQMKYSAFCDNFQHLAAIAKQVVTNTSHAGE
ncbi:B12-binding domain-containing protein [Thalassoglobus sp.]|uniref:B12-binding domain-containing protein n=1 Tax=Thalassoglobus sp. TaxID=2795869 RepID=UPI003AA82ADC